MARASKPTFMNSSIHGSVSGWCTTSQYGLTQMCLLLFFFSLLMNDCKNLEACLSMHWVSLGDSIIKQFWIEKKSTPGKRKKRKKKKKREVILFNAHSEQEVNCCSAHLECQCHFNHARSTSHLTYWGLWVPHTAKSREEMPLAPTELHRLRLRDQADKKTVSFHAQLDTVQTPSAGVFSYSSKETAVKTILI